MTTDVANTLLLIGAATVCVGGLVLGVALCVLAAAIIFIAVNKADAAADDLLQRWRENVDDARDRGLE